MRLTAASTREEWPCAVSTHDHVDARVDQPLGTLEAISPTVVAAATRSCLAHPCSQRMRHRLFHVLHGDQANTRYCSSTTTGFSMRWLVQHPLPPRPG